MISSINPLKPPDLTEKRQKEIERLNERYGQQGPKKVQVKEEKQKSTLVEGFYDLRKESKNQTLIQTSKRSTSFASRAERPIQPPAELRGSDLTVNVKIPLGPIEFKPSTIDPEFSEIEPNSETRLKKRLLSHQTLQDYLSDRYVVRINELYAIIRKVELGRFQGGNDWKVPLVGDWVLFGVIGQKSDFKTTNPYIASQFNRMNNSNQPQDEKRSEQGTSKGKGSETAAVEEEEEVADELNDELQRDDQCKKKGKPETAPEEPKPKQRKFVTFKLIDMSSSKISSSGSGVINMILFEADSEIPNGQEPTQKTYRGGSGGAYEKFWKEQPGTLIGIMNPKVLKNRPQQATNYNRPKTEILSITPENDQSIIVIGRAKDLGSCVAKRLDTGNPCGDWCDLRNCGSNGSNSLAICDFHLQRQVRKVRASRAEFFSGTSGMVQHTGKSFGQSYNRKGKKTDQCDPSTKTGLLPPTQSKRTSINGQITYICGGNRSSLNDVTRNSRMKSFEERYRQPTDFEKVEGMKLKRKRELEEIQMNKILTDQKEKNDNYGLKCIQDAKLVLKKPHPGSTSKTFPQAKKQHLDPKDKSSTSTSSSSSSTSRSIYSTAAVRAIGFDPTHQASNGSKSSHLHSNETTQKSSSAAYNDLLERCPQKQDKLVPKEKVKERTTVDEIEEEEDDDDDDDASQERDHSLGAPEDQDGNKEAQEVGLVENLIGPPHDIQLGRNNNDHQEDRRQDADDDDDDDLIICG